MKRVLREREEFEIMIDRRFLMVMGFLAMLASPAVFADPPCAGVNTGAAAAGCPVGTTGTPGACTDVACPASGTAPATGCKRANGSVVSAGAAI